MTAQRRVGGILLIAGALAILVATLTPVAGTTTAGSQLCVLCGERGVADFLSNVVLFAPLGIGLVLLGVSFRRATLIGILLSAGVEAAQLGIITGRDANIGDVVANGTGAAVGWWLGHTRHWWVARAAGTWRRCAAVGTTTLALLLLALYLLTPALPDTTYYLQWTARFGGMQPYEGRVLATRIAGVALQGPPWRIEQRDSVRSALRSGAVEAQFVTGPPPAGVAPIVSIYDTYGREIMLLGADDDDLVYRYRTRGEVLRLDRPDVRVESLFAGTSVGTTVRLRLERSSRSWCVELDGQQQCGRGFTVGDTWSLLMFPDGWARTQRRIMSHAWLFGVFLATGLLAWRTRTAVAAAFVVTGTLFVAPVLMGFAATPVLQLLAAAAGIAAGHLLARAIARRRGDLPGLAVGM